jgi:hypothetical protein
MIDIRTAKPISLKQAAELYPLGRGGRPTHHTTVQRHIKDGVNLGGGRVIRLEGWRIGYRWFTTVEAVSAFIQSLTSSSLGSVADSAPTPSRKQAIRAAKEECAALGAMV